MRFRRFRVKTRSMQGVDIAHGVAVLTLVLLFVRGGQALLEHYFPNSGSVTAARFIYGGP